MRILIIEDDHATAQSMELMLKSEGFNTYVTDLGEEGVDLARIYDYDLITLDLNLPDMSGADVLKQIRTAGVKTPVIIISGTSHQEKFIQALRDGADDFMRKPFHKDELIARAHAIVRRSKGHASAVVITGEIMLDLDAKQIRVGETKVHLTGKEYQMMELLSLRKGQTLSKEMFLNHLYGGRDEPEMKIIDVFICKLRNKLRALGAGEHIETVWGRGYRLVDTPEEKYQRGARLPGMASKADLVSQHGRALLAIESLKGPVRAATVAARMGTDVDAGYVSNYCQTLAKRGLVDAHGNNRNLTYQLNDAGRAWLAERRPEPFAEAEPEAALA